MIRIQEQTWGNRLTIYQLYVKKVMMSGMFINIQITTDHRE
jgi:hypothetical protein